VGRYVLDALVLVTTVLCFHNFKFLCMFAVSMFGRIESKTLLCKYRPCFLNSDIRRPFAIFCSFNEASTVETVSRDKIVFVYITLLIG